MINMVDKGGRIHECEEQNTEVPVQTKIFGWDSDYITWCEASVHFEYGNLI